MAGGATLNSQTVQAAGGSSMGGAMPAAPSRTPHQIAVDNYNSGLKQRDKAEALQVELAAETNEKKRKKLSKKVKKSWEKAAKRYRTAIKTVPTFYQAHASLGYALKNLGEWDEAMAAYDQALTFRPEYSPAIEYRAEAYLAQQRYDDVMQSHLTLQRVDPEHAQMLEAAIMYWLKTNERNDSNGEFYDWASAMQARLSG